MNVKENPPGNPTFEKAFGYADIILNREGTGIKIESNVWKIPDADAYIKFIARSVNGLPTRRRAFALIKMAQGNDEHWRTILQEDKHGIVSRWTTIFTDVPEHASTEDKDKRIKDLKQMYSFEHVRDLLVAERKRLPFPISDKQMHDQFRLFANWLGGKSHDDKASLLDFVKSLSLELILKEHTVDLGKGTSFHVVTETDGMHNPRKVSLVNNFKGNVLHEDTGEKARVNIRDRWVFKVENAIPYFIRIQEPVGPSVTNDPFVQSLKNKAENDKQKRNTGDLDEAEPEIANRGLDILHTLALTSEHLVYTAPKKPTPRGRR